MVTPAASRRGAPACSISTTGGLTHFIDGLEPDGPSVARCANFAPTGRGSVQARQRSTSSRRLSAATRSVIAAQAGCVAAGSASTPQPWASRNGRGSPNGKSQPATHGPGPASHCSKASREASRRCASMRRTSPLGQSRRSLDELPESERDRLARPGRAAEIDADDLHAGDAARLDRRLSRPAKSRRHPNRAAAAPPPRSPATLLHEKQRGAASSHGSHW